MTTSFDTTLWGLLSERARMHPQRPLWLLNDDVQTYGGAAQRARDVAIGLSIQGYSVGDRVAILAEHSIATWELLLGCAAAGVVPVLINWRLAPPEVAFIVADSDARSFVSTAAFADVATATDLTPAGPPRDLEEFVDELATAGAASPDAQLPEITPDHDLVQLYTSGTTGLPKGVRTSNSSMCRLLSTVAGEMAGFASDSTHLVAAPLFHIAGYGYGVIGLWVGASSVLLPMFDPLVAAMLIERHRCTNSLLVPAMLQAIVEHPDARSCDFSSVRGLLYGASPISESLVRRVVHTFGCRLTQAYGLTETTGIATLLRWDDHELGLSAEEGSFLRKRLASAGTVIAGGELEILDSSGNVVPDGTPGEVATRSPLVMTGYWKRDDANAEVLGADGWFRSGDVGYVEDGYLFLVDRLNDKMVSKGENIYPGEIERVLGEHPEILEVAVIGIPDDEFGERVTAIVVMRDGASLDLGDVQEFCRPHLAGFKLPRELVVLDEPLPRTASGKVLRRTLREPYWVGRDRRIN